MTDRDHFEDIRNNLGTGFGCLSGEGAEEIQTVHTQPLSPQGVTYQVRCQHCGQPNKVHISWDEMIYVAFRLQPPGWVYEASRGALRPNIGCASCNVVILLLLTPDDGAKSVHAGEAAGYIPAGYVAQARQRLAGQAGQLRR